MPDWLNRSPKPYSEARYQELASLLPLLQGGRRPRRAQHAFDDVCMTLGAHGEIWPLFLWGRICTCICGLIEDHEVWWDVCRRKARVAVLHNVMTISKVMDIQWRMSSPHRAAALLCSRCAIGRCAPRRVGRCAVLRCACFGRMCCEHCECTCDCLCDSVETRLVRRRWFSKDTNAPAMRIRCDIPTVLFSTI